MTNVADVLQTTAANRPGRPAVTDVRSSRCLDYGQLARESERVTAFLHARGVEPGHRVGLLAPNGLAYLPAAFGLLATGACLVPLASSLTSTEVAEIADEVDLNGCLAWPSAGQLDRRDDDEILHGGECDGFTFRWTNREAAGPAEFRDVNSAFIRFTSGTTAESKGVVLSHEATIARVEAADRVLRFTTDDRVLWVLPLAYHFAVTLVAYVRAGVHVLMCPDTLPHALADTARRLRPSVLYASPLHFQRLANLSPGAPFDGVRVCLSTSAPIATAVMERFQSMYGVPVGQAYGIIEAGLPCINIGSCPRASVGRAVPGYDVRIVSDAGAPMGRNASGEIVVRGGGLFSAYYAPWRRREEITRDGWFATGDVGRMDEDGAVYLEGRKKAVIFVAGLKFFPEEVEDCINQFPGVKESRVFARAHAQLGEVPCAQIVPARRGVDLAALEAHCATLLSPYKVPVDFTLVDALPRSPGGKILRRPVA